MQGGISGETVVSAVGVKGFGAVGQGVPTGVGVTSLSKPLVVRAVATLVD